MQSLWQSCLTELKKELTPQQFKAWISPLSFIQFTVQDAVLVLGAPSRIKADACARQFGERLTVLASSAWALPVKLVFTITPKTTTPKKPQTPVESIDAQEKIEQVAVAVKKTKQAANKINSFLEKELNFDSLVTGKANQLAQMIGFEVVEQPGKKYNPFFIYGGVGVGKTHLMHAIGNAVLDKNPDANVRYLFANTYVTELVKAYGSKSLDEFKEYYQNLDMLLIDDIQFFGDGDKKGTQASFFEIFETLISANKQIIITSDRYPRALEGIQERLRSRFESGISIEIEPPELEMRVGILLKKAAQENIDLHQDVAFYIAKLLRANVRELEGALRKVIAYSKFHKQKISIETTKIALKDLLSNTSTYISIEAIQKAVADFYKIKIIDMHSTRRPRNIAFPRQIAMYLSKELTSKSLPEIGQNFGGRDHTTVLHAHRKITEDKRQDQQLSHELHLLEQILKG